MSAPPPALTRAQLVQQIEALQQQLAKLNASSAGKHSRRPPAGGPLPASLAAAPKRHVALKFAYDGWAHSGLAWQPPTATTPFTTVEAEILAALMEARLIEPIKDKENEGFGCGFERCGRTDAGVSSSGQVINLWVRSDLEDPMGTGAGKELEGARGSKPLAGEETGTVVQGSRPSSPSGSAANDSDDASSYGAVKPVRRKPASPVEMPYVTIINKHLPATIRILAWSPVAPTFSSRYSCIWRHYKYFFSTSPSQPLLLSQFDFGAAYANNAQQAEWKRRLAQVDFQRLELDVDLMRDAVKRLVGEHDFRNLCKVDPPKQLTTHVRTVHSATIDALEGEGPDMFVLNLRGSAFLYNQVRHIVALLFLIGARLEPPSLIDQLLWTSDRTPTTEFMQPLPSPSDPPTSREVHDRKPGYAMADDLPLVLFECGFNGTALDWRIDNSPSPSSLLPPMELPSGHAGLHSGQKLAADPTEAFRRQYLEVHEAWAQRRLKSVIGKHHLAALAALAPLPSPTPPPERRGPRPGGEEARTVLTPHGAGLFTKTTSYIPVLKRQRNDVPEVQNARWAAGRGSARMEKRVANKERSDRERVANLAVKAEAQRVAEEEGRRGGTGSGEGSGVGV